ncbi:CPBP family glutamic-type intramembrane protease [Kribbella sp. NBC_00709]|uniref:CPBP family glutamic-type intramembrane protease n=1 Tax=Kribbella sp. NBC_00709 TaxID=2975972 RepID=UPI002E291026|nr:CPBP family glutamic-type intramembrane protease [Kribbella sp. NBC_00709]
MTTPTGPLRNQIRRAPLASFLILSCLWSWWPGALQAAGVPLPGPANAGFGPFLAAVLVLGVAQGRAGVRQLLKSMIQWRVPARAYLAGIGLPLLVSGSAILLTVLFGAARPSGSDLALAAQIPIVLVLLLLIPGTGGAWEEPGWRGFALGRLERRYGVLAGPLVLGGFWVFWHAPLFLTGDILWPDVLVIVAASVVVGAVFHAGKDSVLIAMLFHATNNAVGGSFASLLFHGHDQTTLGLVTAAGWWLIAGGVLVRSWRAQHATQTSGSNHVPSAV